MVCTVSARTISYFIVPSPHMYNIPPNWDEVCLGFILLNNDVDIAEYTSRLSESRFTWPSNREGFEPI